MMICHKRSQQGAEIGEGGEGPPQAGSHGSSGVMSRARDSWGGKFWEEEMVCAKAQGSKEAVIFLEQKEDSRGQGGRGR